MESMKLAAKPKNTKPRKRNLKIQITSEEERLHSEFINTLGKDAIWHKIKND